jgi:ethanolamine utilization protein EutN
MLLAEVIGSATSTVKHPSLEGRRMLLAQPYLIDGETPDGDPVLAIDPQGARRGDWVVITSDSQLVRELVNNNKTPIRWAVLAIRD